jgi:hypothetical protein
MAINISPENAQLFEENGYDYDSVKSTIEHYREQGISDEEIQSKINTKIKSFSPTQKGEEGSQKTKQVETSTGNKTSAKKLSGGVSKSQPTKPWYAPALNALPIAGSIVGGVAGSGIMSVPAAAVGAAGGEAIRQRLLGQEKNLKDVASQALYGGIGQGVGLGAGAIFERAMPVIGSKLSGVDKDIYKYAMDVYKKGGNKDGDDWLIREGFRRPPPSMRPDNTGMNMVTAEILTDLLLRGHPGVGALGYMAGKNVLKTMQDPAFHKALLQTYSFAKNKPLTTGFGNMLYSPRTYLDDTKEK